MLFWFLAINCVAFAGLILFGPAAVAVAVPAALALLGVVALSANAYQRRGPLLLHDLITISLLGVSTLG